MDFRCSVASESDDEPIAGTAPTDKAWLLVEDPGPWAPKVALDAGPAWAGHRVQLVRRHRAASTTGTRVFAATLDGEAFVVRTAEVATPQDVATLTPDDLEDHDGLLWLVCTNGRRDVCCAERGRPVASALVERWPDETWETTHLGGHRFAATLLALPSGVVLGRLDPASAVAAVEEVEQGRMPIDVTRGRAGWPVEAQYADLHLRKRFDLPGISQVTRAEADRVTVTSGPGVPRRQSCADDKRKPAPLLIADP